MKPLRDFAEVITIAGDNVERIDIGNFQPSPVPIAASHFVYDVAAYVDRGWLQTIRIVATGNPAGWTRVIRADPL